MEYPILSTQKTTKSYNLLGVKSNGLLFSRPAFIDSVHKRLYRFNRKLWGSAYEFDWKLFITFTAVEDHTTYVPLINDKYHVAWELQHNHIFDKENVSWGIQHSDRYCWDRRTFRYNLKNIMRYGPTAFMRKVMNKFQIYFKRIVNSLTTYLWIYDEGSDHGRVHFHLIIASDEIRSGSRPIWVCKLLDSCWSAGKVHIQAIRKPDDSTIEAFNGVLYYINKYMSKNRRVLKQYKYLEANKRWNGSSRDIAGYRPNPNVFYIHWDQVPEENVDSTNKDQILWIMKKYRVKFLGYEEVFGRFQAKIIWKEVLVQQKLQS